MANVIKHTDDFQPNFKNSKRNKIYGWKRDLPDHRDLKFEIISAQSLPESVDLRAQMPAVYDQGDLGSCTANAIAAAFEFDQRKQRYPEFIPSRLFIYYNERALEGTIRYDSGAAIRDGFRSINTQGVCPETMWPYVVPRFAVRPTATCYNKARLNRATVYRSIRQTTFDMQTCLSSGYPFVFGFSVYSGFESDAVTASGVVNLPGVDEEFLGGHAVLCVGYNNTTQRFIIRNSWGSSWGQHGYFTMPYAYLTNTSLSSDFWTVSTVTRG